MDAVRPRELLLALQRVFLLVKRRAGIAEDGHGQASAPEESDWWTRSRGGVGVVPVESAVAHRALRRESARIVSGRQGEEVGKPVFFRAGRRKGHAPIKITALAPDRHIPAIASQ